jgi:hypothetical protein
MSKSPTLHNIEDNFSRIKRKLGLKRDKSNPTKSIFILLYMVVTFIILLYFKPRIVCKEKMPYYNQPDKPDVSNTRFILFYVLLQIPLLIYITCFS